MFSHFFMFFLNSVQPLLGMSRRPSLRSQSEGRPKRRCRTSHKSDPLYTNFAQRETYRLHREAGRLKFDFIDLRRSFHLAHALERRMPQLSVLRPRTVLDVGDQQRPCEDCAFTLDGNRRLVGRYRV